MIREEGHKKVLIVLSDFCLVQCRVIMETCDGLVMNSKDPLVVQPASLELAIIRKKQGEELVKKKQPCISKIVDSNLCTRGHFVHQIGLHSYEA